MGQVQGQDQGQGQGQDHLLLQRAALPQLYLVLALTLVLTLDLAQITKPPSAKYPFVYSRKMVTKRIFTKRKNKSTTCICTKKQGESS